MKNTIRCCISCILPCGALDVIRIVHSHGHVEEISGTLRAAEIMKLHPKHVLKKPSSPSDQGMCPTMVIVPPDAQLQRGKIYFLMRIPSTTLDKTRSRSSTKKKRRDSSSNISQSNANNNNNNNNNNNSSSSSSSSSSISLSNFLVSDQYLSEILSEKVSTQTDRRKGRTGVWRPHLESISETLSDHS